MGLAEVKADAVLAREQLLKMTDLDPIKLRTQLTENILPLFEGLVDAVAEELGAMGGDIDELDQVVEQLIDETGEIISPETGAKIVGLVEIGKVLADELEGLLAKVDDLSKKRVRQLIKSYRQGAQIVAELVTELVDTGSEDDDDEQPGEGESEPAPDNGGALNTTANDNLGHEER